VTAREFSALFADIFGPAADAAGLSRVKRKSLAWTHQAPDGTALTFGFRLNRRNIAGFPGEFAPDIIWSSPSVGAGDPGDVSFYQYATAQELDAIAVLHKRIVDGFIKQQGVEPPGGELANPDSIVSLLASASRAPIRPNHHRWLPYCTAADVAAWSELFARSVDTWTTRFLESPETLDAWCWRVLWSDRKADGS
jgi:hypothetical protein